MPTSVCLTAVLLPHQANRSFISQLSKEIQPLKVHDRKALRLFDKADVRHPVFPPVTERPSIHAAPGVFSSRLAQIETRSQHVLIEHRGLLHDVPIGTDNPTLPMRAAGVWIGGCIGLDDIDRVLDRPRLDLSAVRAELAFFTQAGFER